MSIHPFLQRPHPAITVSWQGRLDACDRCEEVVSVARDFLASFSPYEIAVLPQEVRPPAKLHDGEDLTPYAFDLVRRNCDKDPPAVADLVHKLGHFFSHASIRLAEIQARAAAEEAAGSEEEERRSA